MVFLLKLGHTKQAVLKIVHTLAATIINDFKTVPVRNYLHRSLFLYLFVSYLSCCKKTEAAAGCYITNFLCSRASLTLDQWTHL